MRELVVIAEACERKLIPKNKRHLPLLITGAGAGNIINALKDIPINTFIYNYGYCGAIGYDIGEVLEVATVREYRRTAKIKSPEFLLAHIGVDCYTALDFVKDEVKRIKKGIFDMELYFICALGFQVMSVKTVSDNLSYKKYKENAKC